jgi:hypothetical protein
MMFLDCPAYLDEDGAARCGLPAEVRRRFTLNSTDGPLESAMIRCPVGHWFNGPIGSLTWQTSQKHDPGRPGVSSSACARQERHAGDRGRAGSHPAGSHPAGSRPASTRPGPEGGAS